MTYHTYDSRRSNHGFPDCIFVRDGVLVFIELKREKGKPTLAQLEWIDALATVPGVKFCGVIRPSGWFAGELDEVLR